MKNQTNYEVNGTSFGKQFGDAQRFAMKRAIETGVEQIVLSGDKRVVGYKRGTSGLARMAFSATY